MRAVALVATVASLAALAGLSAAQVGYDADGGTVPPDAGTPPPAGPYSIEERYDIDCDPDIEVCVDPNEQQGFDDGYDPNAYQQFQAALEPYGTWFDDPGYGRVWAPSPDVVGADFMPYATSGQWVATADYGFAWSSDYDWGWAPFHYGRWIFLVGWGWSWVPGTLWGPAWVEWRYGGGYCGWAPLPPRGVIIPPPRALGVRSPWRFALSTELFRRNPTYVPANVVPNIWARTQPVRNLRTVGFGAVEARVNLGPPLAAVARDLGRPVPALGLKNTAPSILPRSNIVPRPGVSLPSRSYMQSGSPRAAVPASPRAVMPAPSLPAPQPYRLGTPGLDRPFRQSYSPPPSARAPTYEVYTPPSTPPQVYSTPPAYRTPPPSYAPPAQTYTPPPVYRTPQQYVPPQSYAPPAQTYTPPPAYRAPAQTYTPPPVYRAPAQTYTPPPSYQRPSAPPPAPVFRAPAMSAPPAAPPPSMMGGSRRRF